MTGSLFVKLIRAGVYLPGCIVVTNKLKFLGNILREGRDE